MILELNILKTLNPDKICTAEEIAESLNASIEDVQKILEILLLKGLIKLRTIAGHYELTIYGRQQLIFI